MEQPDYNRTFNIQQTNMAKGIACILLLIHHLFYDDPHWQNLFTPMFPFLQLHGKPLITIFAMQAKVCVAIFIFLSGYGLTASFSKKFSGILSLTNSIRFVCSHIVKLFISYWFIFIIFVPWGAIFGHNSLTIWNYNPVNAFNDIFGISFLFGTDSVNVTWWFISAIILLYILFPIFMILSKNGVFPLLIVALIITFDPLLSLLPFQFKILSDWLLPFVLGMILSNTNAFNRIDSSNIKVKETIEILFVVLIAAILCYTYGIKFYSLLAISIILFSYLVLSKSVFFMNILGRIGNNSSNIFMFHTFIYYYYFEKYIYVFKYPILIFVVLLFICYFISLLLEKLKSALRIDKISLWLSAKILGNTMQQPANASGEQKVS